MIDWPKIDQGRTRLDRLAEIEAANDNREKERDGKGKGAAAATASMRAAVPSAPDVSRLRLALDRARQRLDALGARLDQAFSRLKERLTVQDRRAGPETAKPTVQLRSALDAFRRDRRPHMSGLAR